ncbi:MAG: hypothetical protein WAM97_16815 [Acidimicrobiales bacterium]|jgi:hypothetical protein
MTRTVSVRWNEKAQKWMAWVTFPDGSRRKVERVDKRDAEADLNALLAMRAGGQEVPKRQRMATFRDLTDEWIEAGCPSSTPGTSTRHAKEKSPNTIANANLLVGCHVTPAIGALWVDRTTTERLEEVFAAMAEAGYATSTVDRTWGYLNQACQYALRCRRIKLNPGPRRAAASGPSVETEEVADH